MSPEKTRAMFAALGRGETIETLYEPTKAWFTVTPDSFAGCPSAVPSMVLISDWRIKRVPLVCKAGRSKATSNMLGKTVVSVLVPEDKLGRYFSVVATEILDD